ncbi:Putative AC9 transposase, partial [Linum grandiflorum]
NVNNAASGVIILLEVLVHHNRVSISLLASQRKRSKTSSKLDNYLNKEILPHQPDFDILMWWKINGPKYPILQGIARDIVVASLTSVASESAFSSGRRLLDPH